MPEQFKMNLSIQNDRRKQYKIVKPLKLENIIQWIYNLNYDEELTKNLIQIVSKMPEGAYRKFKKDFAIYLEKARNGKKEKIKGDVCPEKGTPDNLQLSDPNPS